MRLLKRGGIEPGIGGAAIEEAPADGHNDRHDEREEDPAIDHMIEAGGEFDIGVVGDEHGAPGAYSVRQDRDQERGRTNRRRRVQERKQRLATSTP
jgi:hypothetical protein